MWHLLSNGIRFTPNGGAVDVSIEANGLASVSVRDAGPGIDPGFLPRIFDRFTQADPSPTRTSNGLGVGLSLVRDLVERHGGDIQAANAAKGLGAIFTVRLPLHPADQIERPIAPSPTLSTASSPPLTGLRVLVVDHNQDSREFIAITLERRGAAVRLVSSVGEALEILETWRPDVLVSDGAFPDRDAYALIAKVRALESERGGRIPALALTTIEGADEGMRRMLSEVKRSLPKPVEPAVLAAEIARLAGRERRRANRAQGRQSLVG
jgi:CheY-like chemotaxis protein